LDEQITSTVVIIAALQADPAKADSKPHGHQRELRAIRVNVAHFRDRGWSTPKS